MPKHDVRTPASDVAPVASADRISTPAALEKPIQAAADGLDMGARRYGPDAARFLQPDVFNGALSDLALSSDPLTANRYGLAGGNPLSFIESDGHMPVPVGDLGGGGAPAPKPSAEVFITTMAQEISLSKGEYFRLIKPGWQSAEGELTGWLRERFPPELYDVVENTKGLRNEAGQMLRWRTGRGGYIIPDRYVFNRASGRLVLIAQARAGKSGFYLWSKSGPTARMYFRTRALADKVYERGPAPAVEVYTRYRELLPAAVRWQVRASRTVNILSVLSILGAAADKVQEDRVREDVDWLRTNDPDYYWQLPADIRNPDAPPCDDPYNCIG